ncbi:MAG TPA: tetratricopeptide repeat protein [Candidatus Binatia bacterium]|nr:tetratricopeptide repeat protein [Candidatus Binatia bacterium]
MSPIGSHPKRWLAAVAAALIVEALQGCAPPRSVYRPIPSPPAVSRPLPEVPPAPPPQEAAKKPLPQESKIREQDLQTKPIPPALEQPGSAGQPAETGIIPERAAPPLADDSSLIAKITPGTEPRRAASLRLTEEGRKLLDSGEPAKAINRLERTIAIDSTNPYGYFYLAKAQHRLGRYQESLNFLDVAESRLSGSDRFWLAEVYALRGENYRALGMADKAETNYAQALRLNSGNRTAAEALDRLQSDHQPPLR